MKIDKLIEILEQIKKQYGNIECVQETTDLFDNLIDSTIESVKIVEFNKEKAVRLDWRM